MKWVNSENGFVQARAVAKPRKEGLRCSRCGEDVYDSFPRYLPQWQALRRIRELLLASMPPATHKWYDQVGYPVLLDIVGDPQDVVTVRVHDPVFHPGGKAHGIGDLMTLPVSDLISLTLGEVA